MVRMLARVRESGRVCDESTFAHRFRRTRDGRVPTNSVFEVGQIDARANERAANGEKPKGREPDEEPGEELDGEGVRETAHHEYE